MLIKERDFTGAGVVASGDALDRIIKTLNSTLRDNTARKDPRQASSQSDEASTTRPSIGRRVFRAVVWGFIISVIVVGVAFAWQFNGDDKTMDLVRAWGVWLLSAEPVSKPSGQAPTQDTALLQTVSVPDSPPASVAARSSPELQHQLETTVSDLAVVRRIVEQLAARQEQMTQEIATLQAAEQKLSAAEQKSADQAPMQAVAAKSPPELQHQFETTVSDLAVVRRIVEQLAAWQEQVTQEIATLQAAERDLSKKISSPRKNVPRVVRSEATAQTPPVGFPVPAPPAADRAAEGRTPRRTGDRGQPTSPSAHGAAPAPPRAGANAQAPPP
jgi:hypothetical protein